MKLQTRKMHKRSAPRRGFTLLEVLLVLAILVILGGAVTFSITRLQRSGYTKAAATQVNGMRVPLDAYRLDIGSYPSKGQGLTALIQAPADLANSNKWEGPYLQPPVLPLDPWDQPYQYELVDEETYHIWSFGPNQQNENGGGDDISNLQQLMNQQ